MDAVPLDAPLLWPTSLHLPRLRTVSFSGYCGWNPKDGWGPRPGTNGYGVSVPGRPKPGPPPFSRCPGQWAAHAYQGPSSPLSAAACTKSSRLGVTGLGQSADTRPLFLYLAPRLITQAGVGGGVSLDPSVFPCGTVCLPLSFSPPFPARAAGQQHCCPSLRRRRRRGLQDLGAVTSA